MDVLKRFGDIAQNPHDYAATWKRQYGRKVFGHFCSYTPEELINAAGVLPFRIFGSGAPISLADAHLQAYSCSLVRSSLNDALAGKLDFLDGTVFPHTCDSIQRLSDVWRLNVQFDVHLDVLLPVKLNTESAREYMADVLLKFKKDLERSIQSKITPDELMRSAETYNRIRTSLKSIYEMRRHDSGLLSGQDLLNILKAAMVMDREELVQSLDTLVKGLGQTISKKKDENRKRIILAGGICNIPEIYSVIEDAGGSIVWDDLCTGSRYFDGTIDLYGDIIGSIAERYIDRIHCPAKHAGLYRRGGHLVRLAREMQANGIIFIHLKFCDPHAFDYPYLKEQLDKENIPSMLFEIEEQIPSARHFKTRSEAFLEML